MKNRGFTVIEILVVIMILGVIMVFAVPAIMESSRGAKEATYQTKKASIETAAKLYFQEAAFDEGEEKRITVGDLASAGELVYDDDNKKIIEDPRGKYGSLNKCEIVVTKDNISRRISAKLDEDTCN